VCSKLEWLMVKRADTNGVAPEALEGARSATGSASGAAEVKRWSTGRKRGVVLRLLRGESVDAVSREVGVTIAELEQWRELALAGMEAGLKARTSDPLEARLNDAVRRVGELSMENEILRKERELQARRPLTGRRSST
jgi:transposase